MCQFLNLPDFARAVPPSPAVPCRFRPASSSFPRVAALRWRPAERPGRGFMPRLGVGLPPHEARSPFVASAPVPALNNSTSISDHIPLLAVGRRRDSLASAP
jgi:hypothetical protein